MITSYKGAENMYRGCRSAKNGKPLPAHWRLFKEKDTFIICLPSWRGYQTYTSVARITRNNHLTFVLPKDKLLEHSNVIVIAMCKLTNISIQRFAKGKYRVGKSTGWNGLSKEYSQEYYNGIKFDLLTGLCLNPRPDESVEPVPENRKVWLQELKRFKRGLKARVKVGALTVHIAEANKARDANNRLPWQERVTLAVNWESDQWRKRLVSCMKKEVYPPDLLMAFIQSSENSWRSKAITQEHVLENVDKVFTRHSEVLRREYGVFGKTLHKKK